MIAMFGSLDQPPTLAVEIVCLQERIKRLGRRSASDMDMDHEDVSSTLEQEYVFFCSMD